MMRAIVRWRVEALSFSSRRHRRDTFRALVRSNSGRLSVGGQLQASDKNVNRPLVDRFFV
jgi:hypothetical protein